MEKIDTPTGSCVTEKNTHQMESRRADTHAERTHTGRATDGTQTHIHAKQRKKGTE